MAEALYRKYRPQVFDDVVGQEPIERTLKNAIDQDKVSHAYLFCGSRGTGKTTTARILAKALLCENGPTSDPDGTCVDCELIAAGEHPDVYELDAASRTGVDNVREEIIGRVQFAPTRGRYKIYIIDEVHMLSVAAFNALLKTLEEPPDHVVFILATTDPQKVPETIQSRCQRFDFRRIPSEVIVSYLGAICVAEGFEFEGDALELIAHRAEGGMRDALTSLEQLITFGEGQVSMEVAERMLGSLDVDELFEIVRYIGTRDIASCFRWTAAYVEKGADLAQFTGDLAEHVRNLYVMSLAGADVALEVSDATRRELTSELSLFGSDRLARLLSVLGDLSAELKTSTNPRLSFEIALTRMVRPDSDYTLGALTERVEALEAGYSAVAHVVSQDESKAVDSTKSADMTDTTDTVNTTSVTDTIDAVESCASEQENVFDKTSFNSEENSLDEQNLTPENMRNASSQLSEILANPAALQRMWRNALDTFKKAKAAHSVLFLNTKVRYDETNHTLIIEFPAESDFAFKTAQKAEVKDELSKALMQSCGENVAFCLVKHDDASSAERVFDTQEFTAVSEGGQGSVSADENDRKPTPKDEDDRKSTPTDEDDRELASVNESSMDDTEEEYISESVSTPTSTLQEAEEIDSHDLAEPDDPTVDELDAALTFGFGDGISFTEV